MNKINTLQSIFKIGYCLEYLCKVLENSILDNIYIDKWSAYFVW